MFECLFFLIDITSEAGHRTCIEVGLGSLFKVALLLGLLNRKLCLAAKSAKGSSFWPNSVADPVKSIVKKKKKPFEETVAWLQLISFFFKTVSSSDDVQ